MMTQFKALFAVTIAHTYYGEDCKDVDFVIPAGTAKALKNGRLLTKGIEGRLYVLFETDEAEAPMVLLEGKTLRMGLRLSNPFFSNFTQVDAGFASSQLFYRNASTPTALDAPVKVTLIGQVFSHALTDSARPVTVTLKDAAGQGFQIDEITASNDRSTVSYDLTGYPSGAYTVEEAFPGDTTENAYYCDAELAQAGVFGILEVKIDNDFYVAAPEFQVAFNARQETLKYYVVARNYPETEFNQLSVLDAGFAELGLPPINFTKVPSDSFTDAEIAPALLGGSAARVVLFKSQGVVARTEKARKKIQLKKNGEVLIAHLPQPRVDKPNADLIIPVSKP